MMWFDLENIQTKINDEKLIRLGVKEKPCDEFLSRLFQSTHDAALAFKLELENVFGAEVQDVIVFLHEANFCFVKCKIMDEVADSFKEKQVSLTWKHDFHSIMLRVKSCLPFNSLEEFGGVTILLSERMSRVSKENNVCVLFVAKTNLGLMKLTVSPLFWAPTSLGPRVVYYLSLNSSFSEKTYNTN